MSRVRIKFCGMTRAADVAVAGALGADAIGVVLTARGPRALGFEQARAVLVAVPPFVTRVGLFMNDASDAIAAALATLPLDALQFHGDEPAAFCRRFGKPWLKSVAMGDSAADALERARRDYPDAAALVLDGHRAGEAGGSGERFDWSRAADGGSTPIVIAGGLDADNVLTAIERARPYAVDVSSGIESAPGIKDHDNMQRFIAEVNRVRR